MHSSPKNLLPLCRVAALVLATCAAITVSNPATAADFIAVEGVASFASDSDYDLMDASRISKIAVLRDTSRVVSGHENLPSRFLCTSTGSVSGAYPVLIPVRVMPGSISIPAVSDFFVQGPDVAAGEGNTVVGSDVQSSFDMDHDGVPSYFESLFGSNPAVPNANQDIDGDGHSLLFEYLAGTNPLDANSALRLSATRGLSTITLSWPSVSGKKYEVQSADTVVSLFSAVSNVTANSSISRVRVPLNDGTSFYRVLVKP